MLRRMIIEPVNDKMKSNQVSSLAAMYWSTKLPLPPMARVPGAAALAIALWVPSECVNRPGLEQRLIKTSLLTKQDLARFGEMQPRSKREFARFGEMRYSIWRDFPRWASRQIS